MQSPSWSVTQCLFPSVRPCPVLRCGVLPVQPHSACKHHGQRLPDHRAAGVGRAEPHGFQAEAARQDACASQLVPQVRSTAAAASLSCCVSPRCLVWIGCSRRRLSTYSKVLHTLCLPVVDSLLRQAVDQKCLGWADNTHLVPAAPEPGKYTTCVCRAGLRCSSWVSSWSTPASWLPPGMGSPSAWCTPWRQPTWCSRPSTVWRRP